MSIKNKLLQHCKELIEARLKNAEDAMNRAQESANDNEKAVRVINSRLDEQWDI